MMKNAAVSFIWQLLIFHFIIPRWDAARQDASEALQLSPALPGGILAMARAEAGEGGNTTASIQYYETYVCRGGVMFHAFFICVLYLLYHTCYMQNTYTHEVVDSHARRHTNCLEHECTVC